MASPERIVFIQFSRCAHFPSIVLTSCTLIKISLGGVLKYFGKRVFIGVLAFALIVVGLPAATVAASAATSSADVPAARALTTDAPASRASTGKWGKRITYRDYTARPKMVRAAFKAWQGSVKGLKFVRKTRGKVNIKVLPKACPANTTPCAYYPQDGGSVYMGSWWKKGGDLDNVYDDTEQPLLIHEIGHALGLTHVSKGCSIMYHYVNDWNRACGQLNWPQGKWFCAPQMADAKRIARKYKVKVRPGAGTCSLAQLYPWVYAPDGSLLPPS